MRGGDTYGWVDVGGLVRVSEQRTRMNLPPIHFDNESHNVRGALEHM